MSYGPYGEGVTLFDLPAPAAAPGVAAVAAELRRLDPDGTRMAKVFRATFDQLNDGQHTGRYNVDQLFKTEKTHFGTLIGINLQRELKLADGEMLDFEIAGLEVDCKYSHTGAWMLPIESFDQIILVTQADDQRSVWRAGVVRVTEENRRTSENRDKKTGLNAHGRSQITWLFKDAPMQPNALLQLPPSIVAEIMAASSGQARLNDLFRRATNRRLSRNIIATVAQQDDYMKRVRDNGGSRSALRAISSSAATTPCNATWRSHSAPRLPSLASWSASRSCPRPRKTASRSRTTGGSLPGRKTRSNRLPRCYHGE